MSSTTHILLCHYVYDAVDRLAARSAAGQANSQCFYQNNRLTSEIQGQVHRAWLQTPEQLLARQRLTASTRESTLLATDTQASVLHGLSTNRQQAYAYTVYGNRHPASDALHLPGFNREQPDPFTGHYLLGNGYRVFNPVLMRFNSPDNESPFGRGGLNSYAYCMGDPVNQTDPGGHMPRFLKGAKGLAGRPNRSAGRSVSPPVASPVSSTPAASQTAPQMQTKKPHSFAAERLKRFIDEYQNPSSEPSPSMPPLDKFLLQEDARLRPQLSKLRTVDEIMTYLDSRREDLAYLDLVGLTHHPFYGAVQLYKSSKYLAIDKISAQELHNFKKMESDYIREAQALTHAYRNTLRP